MLVVAALAAGCGSKSSAKTSAGAGAGAGATSTTVKPSSAAAGSVKSVDLVMTGQDPATVKGTKGRCSIGATQAGYDFGSDDYPSLGTQAGISILRMSSSGTPQLKILINGNYLFDMSNGQGIKISADNKHVDVDLDLTHGSVAGSGQPSTTSGHLKGTIDCN
jgi:hypothetical protein